MGVRKFKGEEQGQKTQAIATPRLSFMALCVEVGKIVPGRPLCLSGRADRPRSAAGMGSGFSPRSGMVPDPVPGLPRDEA